jgi:alcohol dehydrogenase class IV
MNFTFTLPGKIVFGPGKISETGRVSAGFGKKALLVCDPFCVSSGLTEKILKNLSASKIKAIVFDGVVPNPTTTSIEKGVLKARKGKCDVIIGLGGGSAIDTAKAIAVGASHPEPIWNYAIGKSPVTDKTLPVIAITTTSGTGSHCTHFSVITNPETRQKPGMGSPYILPKVAIVDPELMLSMPKTLTAICGFDVLSHAIEAYTSNAANPMSDLFAEKAITLCCQYLPTAYKDGKNLEAREMMALADTYAGIAICHAVVSLGHVVAHVIGGHYPDISHGDALFTIYREVLALNSKSKPMKKKHDFISMSMDKSSKNIGAAFDKFFAALAFEKKLISKRPDKNTIDLIATETFTYMKGIADLNPVAADAEDVKRILKKSLKV